MGNGKARARAADTSRLEAASSSEGVPIACLCQVRPCLEVVALLSFMSFANKTVRSACACRMAEQAPPGCPAPSYSSTCLACLDIPMSSERTQLSRRSCWINGAHHPCGSNLTAVLFLVCQEQELDRFDLQLRQEAQLVLDNSATIDALVCALPPCSPRLPRALKK